jgi:hypothetical protein
MGFLEWLQNTGVARLVSESLWGYPSFETIHTVGMALLIGAPASYCRSHGSGSR